MRQMSLTSVEAFEDIQHDDKRLKGRRLEVFNVIRGHVSACAHEVAAELNWPVHCVSGRMTELRELGLIEEDHVGDHPLSQHRVKFFRASQHKSNYEGGL